MAWNDHITPSESIQLRHLEGERAMLRTKVNDLAQQINRIRNTCVHREKRARLTTNAKELRHG